ncbi:MAG: glycosyl hydrolase family 18 protein, partial [Bacteroidales bacterium]|nr:glycosyl hydrolase family 18 protein [Bacteroidales bacterium]
MNNKFTKLKSMILILSIPISLFTANLTAQVNTGGKATKADHNKQVIGYITNWDAWKSAKAGLPAQGALTHLNIDYSKYTILNYSFFGVANNGSLHSGDFRNKQIYQPGAVQKPADLFYADIYSSWDLHLLFGEIDPIQYINADVQKRAEAQGFEVEVGGTTWHHPAWGLSGDLPVPLHKENGAPGLLELAHKNDVKVVAAIGGWSMCKHFPEMAADPVKRKRFIDDCVKLINTGFDGIDIDWEYPGPYPGMNFTGTQADYKNFLTLVTEIRAAIGPDKLITAAFSASAARLKGFDWNALNKVMDYFNFMTYDFNGGWSNIAGHNSPMNTYSGAEAPDVNWTDVLKELNTMGVPSNKICMGTAFYGRGVICEGTAALNKKTVKRSETVQPDGPITTCADFTNWARDVYDGTPHYFYILQKTGTGSGWTKHWDNEAKVPYMTNGKYFLSYDDEQSVSEKAQFINDNNLAGTIIWTVFGDLQFGGIVTNYGTKLKRWSDVKSPLVNKINEVFAQGTGNLSPTCTIASPKDGQKFNVGEVVKVKVSASDKDGTIKKVQFFVNGELKFTDKTSPYVYKLKVTSGTQSIKAIAIDNEGAKKESQTIKVNGGSTGNKIPVVEFINPSNNSTFGPGESIGIKVNASDSDGSISKIELLNGATILSTATKSPLSYAWKNAGIGSHQLTARVTDNDNATNTATITISVKSSQNTSDRIPRVVGYVTSWQGDLNNIDFSQLTHVNYSFAIPTAKGTIEPIKNVAKLKDLVKKAHAENVNVLVAVGGWELGDGGGNDSRFEKLAASASTRKTFVNTMMDLVHTYNLDGIDIDWEYPDPDGSGGPEKNFTLLMKELATALHAEGKLLSAAVVAKGWTGNGIGVEVFDVVDYLNLMAYDGGNGEYHSPYSLAVNSLDFWTGRGLPKNKTVLGVPFYGRPSWKSYSQLLSEGADPFADKFNEVYYNGIKTIKAKSELALK